MAWVKLDDRFPRHPKVLGLSDRAFRVFLESLCYCAEQLTDGELPVSVVKAAPRKAVAELLEAGLLDQEGDVWKVHDYLAYNRTRADVLGSRDSAAERMRGVRANFDEGLPNPVPVPVPVQRASKAFARFWAAYPRKVGKRTAETAFGRACTRSDPEAIVAGAARLAADPNLPDVQFIPHPTTWLNRDGWEDDTLPPRTSGKARQVSNILALADRVEER